MNKSAKLFVTGHRAMARIALGLQDCLYLGNLSALRDWGHARDYVQAQWLMLQQPQAEDFVIATGVQYSVRQFVEFSARELGITFRFQREGDGKVAVVAQVDGDKAQCKAGVPPRRCRNWWLRWWRPTTSRRGATAWSSRRGSRRMTTTSRTR